MKYTVVLSFCVLISACQATQISGTDSIDVELAEQASQAVDCNCEPPSEGVIEVVHPVSAETIPELPADTSIAIIEEPIVESDLWQYISNNLEFGIPENQSRITSQKNWYLKHPNYMKRVSRRASPFLYHIVDELKENDIPLDIALLPIVESAFDPFAYSHSQAAGMWQFIPATGKRFGMPQNWWYDGRRDVIRSTEGAIKYLQYLYKFFDGNWLHALAAYNSGEGRVKRAIRRNQAQNKPTDFWSLDLPRETRAYVPKLLALADILKNSDKYNFQWPALDNAPVINVVTLDRQIELSRAAEFAGLSLNEFRALNPGFNRWATAPEVNVDIILPINSVQPFQAALQSSANDTLVSWQRHKIKSGENLGSIARKYSTTVDVIQTLNNLKNSRIIAGKHLLIPVGVDSDSSISKSIARQLKEERQNTRSQTGMHVVQSGDTLWDIAKAHKVSVKDLSAWNSISAKQTLKVGTKLKVYGPATVDNLANKRINYRVRKGDSLSRIADKFNITVREIISWNNLHGQKYLQPGQRLQLNINVTAL